MFSNVQISKWIRKEKLSNKLFIKKKNKNKLYQWQFDKNLIYNKNKNFFEIKPYAFKQNNKKWFQPLIHQKEEGILGIIKKQKSDKDYYLLQTKAEPGNINNIQISPTVQATKSNYLRKHGGKKTIFLNYFLGKKKNIKIISSLKLSEQGSRFYQKKNRNILIEARKFNTTLKSSFRWLTKENIKYLLKKNNILNMDTISVFSSIIKKNQIDLPINNFIFLQKRLQKLKKFLKIEKKNSTFSNLKGWNINSFHITDLKKKFFSIFFLDVLASKREVSKWDQPIISDHFKSLNGFIICKINGTIHYLLKVTQEPGFSVPKFTSTISEKNFLSKNFKNIKFSNLFKKNKLLLNITNSDEGGRFFKNQSKNVICEINDLKRINLDKDYIWASHNQIVELINKNLITIEARILFACYNIDKIK